MKSICCFISFLFMTACATKTESYYYSADCGYLVNDSLVSGNVSLFFEGMDSITVIVPGTDPVLKVGSTEQDPGKTIQVSGLSIDYSNPDSIYAFTIKNTKVIDTLVSMDSVTMVESIMVVANEVSDTLGTCQFKKVNGKYKGQ
ncbi:MAG: hypothetical protein IPM48_07290 [Saprospiraceae bacterium]|nr:hypothetical protein [Saprospiraceae bacterium]